MAPRSGHRIHNNHQPLAVWIAEKLGMNYGTRYPLIFRWSQSLPAERFFSTDSSKILPFFYHFPRILPFSIRLVENSGFMGSVWYIMVHYGTLVFSLCTI